MKPKQLRNGILHLAITGKLVKQNPNDEPASVLLKKIRAEKQKLIKEGKVKKDKNESVIFRGEDGLFYEKIGKEVKSINDEIPFEIPDSWQWVRLGNIVYFVGNRNNQILAKELLKEGKYPAVSQGIKLIEGYCNDDSKVIKDLPLVMFGDHTRNVKYIDFEFVISADGTKFMKPILCDPKFFYYCMKITAIKLKNRGYERHFVLLKEKVFPLPPLQEQKRIAEKLDEIMPLIDIYDENYTELEKLDREFPNKMKKSILQEAIKGKLVKQNPNDEPAIILLEKIRAEKQKLIKEGKIKKDKNESVIFRGEDGLFYEKIGKEVKSINDEIPFEIPDFWQWVRLGNVCSIFGGKRIPVGRKLISENTGHIYIRVSDMKNGNVNTENLLYVPSDIYPSISKYIINKEDIYITVAGTIGKVGKIPICLDGANLTENANKLVFKFLNQDWLIFSLQSLFIQNQIYNSITKTAQPKLAIMRIEKFLIPLPPLQEQKRIVAKIEEIFKELESLEED